LEVKYPEKRDGHWTARNLKNAGARSVEEMIVQSIKWTMEFSEFYAKKKVQHCPPSGPARLLLGGARMRETSGRDRWCLCSEQTRTGS
jgi:hypothetical protein